MKKIMIILLFGLILAFGCVQPQVPPIQEPNITGEQFCDAVTPCETGECYKFEDKENPICFEGDPCSRCPSGGCYILESYPMQIRCVDEEFCGWSTNGDCSTDSDCRPGGCSGQACESINEKPSVTICDWRDCYDPGTYSLSCGCVEGKCQWHK